MEKIKIGWFSYSCCEDNTVVMTEVMNDHWEEWKKIFDFRHVRVLKSKNIYDEFDIDEEFVDDFDDLDDIDDEMTFSITYTHNNSDFFIYQTSKELIDLYIINNFTIDKLIGKKIFIELIQKVFNPNRLLKLCSEYNIDLQKLINIY
jgi:hypothetical protein